MKTDMAGGERRKDGTLLSPVWTLRRGDRNAVCYVAARVSGHELCLTVGGDPVWRHVCHSQDELIEVQQEWRAALKCRGWKTSGIVES
jgi:hypothetical protein